MKHFSLKVITLLFAAHFLFVGYQCASQEITSARLYIQQKNYDKAIASLQSEVAKNPQSAEGYFLLGVVYAEKEDVDNMVDAFNNSLAIAPTFKKDIDGYKLSQWGNYFNKGVGLFNKATQAKDKDTANIFYAKSIDAFNKGIKINPDSSDTYKNLAFVYLNKGDYDLAIPPLKKIIEKDKALDGYKLLGEIYNAKGETQMSKFKSSKVPADSVEAIALFTEAVKILKAGTEVYPENSDMLVALSQAYINANMSEVATNAFKALVEKDPGNKLYTYNYGVLLLGANDFDNAVAQFKKSLELDPTFINAHYNLAVTYVKWAATLNDEAEKNTKPGQKPEENPKIKELYRMAVPEFEVYLATKQDDAIVWDLLGKVYAILGDLTKAQDAMQKADQYR